jgi:mannose-6-phosphate isomerase-like protein (cupin superfamily)
MGRSVADGIASETEMVMQRRRIVTDHDATGKAIVRSDGPAPVVHTLKSIPGYSRADAWSRYSRAEVWSTAATPAPIGSDWNPDKRRHTLTAPRNGTALKIVEIPPDPQGMNEPDPSGAPHPMMRRTETVDYAIVLSGDVHLVLDDSEILVRKGDVVVLQGNNHAWSNRGKQACCIALFMIDGKYDQGLLRKLASRRLPLATRDPGTRN